MLNSVHIMGHLTRDPETRSFGESGNSIAKGGLACNRKYKTQSGELKEVVTFIDFDVGGRQGENFAKYCRKGDTVLLEGELSFDQWEDKEGNKRSRHYIRVQRVRFIRIKAFENSGGETQAKAEDVEEVPF